MVDNARIQGGVLDLPGAFLFSLFAESLERKVAFGLKLIELLRVLLRHVTPASHVQRRRTGVSCSSVHCRRLATLDYKEMAKKTRGFTFVPRTSDSFVTPPYPCPSITIDFLALNETANIYNLDKHTYFHRKNLAHIMTGFKQTRRGWTHCMTV